MRELELPSAAPRTRQRRDVPLASSISRLALVFLVTHTVFSALAVRNVHVPTYVFVVDGLLLAAFGALNTVRVPWQVAKRASTQIARLWTPLVFFWFGYKWCGWTLYAFYPPEASFDGIWIGLDGLLGQPSLWMALDGPRWLTELAHFGYASYFVYAPILGIYLTYRRRYQAFEQFAFAVTLGYFVSYPVFALLPVWGPRWGLVAAGLLDASQQRLTGYWLTEVMSKLMWGLALKGGAMPSSHSSTAVIFCTWCWKLWGRKGGIPATILGAGMFFGAIYGRYHYVVDVVAGILIGLVSMWLASKLKHQTVRETVESSA